LSRMDVDSPLNAGELQLLWLELTSQCNLTCVHCYAESGPGKLTPDALTTEEYIGIIDSAASLGCRDIQFIGGEPTLFRDLNRLIAHTRSVGCGVEVYTNALSIPADLLACFIEHRVDIATSFYCDVPTIHDQITQRKNSHAMTVRTIRHLVEAGLNLRVSIISMELNQAHIETTRDFLLGLGVTRVRVDRARAFGRASALVPFEIEDPISELCGYCWNGRLCVSPEGIVWPCTMSRAWPVGSLRHQTLSEILQSPKLASVRQQIYSAHFVKDAKCVDAKPAGIGPRGPGRYDG